jgi:glycerophosphoryl diester phosphodiesterase
MRPRVVQETPRPRWGRRTTPLVIAHRGASADAPENTLAAFALAREVGADGVELDVMRCGTGEVVVFHDDDLKRLGNGRTESIRQTPLEALREVDLGGGERIPTLEEVLATLGPHMLVNIELKAPDRKGLQYLSSLRDEGLAHAVAGLVARHGATSRALVSSFDPFLLGRFRRAAPAVPIGLLFTVESMLPLRHAWATPLLQPAAVHPDARMVEARAVRRWHREGRAVNVWTVDDPHEVACLAALGVDGIITNRPAETRALLEG